MSNNGDGVVAGVACTCDLDPCLCAASGRAFRARRDNDEVIVPFAYPVTFPRSALWPREVSPIHDAARFLDVDGLRQALARGLSPDLRDDVYLEGRTALHLAVEAVAEQDDFRLYQGDGTLNITYPPDFNVCEEDVAVRFKTRSLRVTVRGETLLDSPLKGRCIDPDKCRWTLRNPSEGPQLLYLELSDRNGKTWPRCLERTLPGLAAPRERAEACVAALIQAGASVNLKTDDGLTPLHCAARNRRPGVCQLLCAAGADVEARDDVGWTPLSYAISSYDCLAVLLAAGARIDAATTAEGTPWDVYRGAIGDLKRCDAGEHWPCTKFGLPDLRAYPLFIRAGATFRHPTYFCRIQTIQQYVERVFAAGGFPAYEKAHLVRGTKTVESKLRLPARPARLVAEYWLHAGFY